MARPIRDPYSERVRALFAAPAHAGRADGPRAYAEGQGVRVELTATLAGERLEALRFRAFGCPHLLAATEALCAEFEGAEVGRLEAMAASELIDALAIPVAKTGRILVLEDAAHSLGRRCRESLRH